MGNSPKPVTVRTLAAMKQAGQKISMLTAYDYAMARLVDAAGVEVILVGDSLGMVVQGHADTLPVTVEEMIYHGEMVVRAVDHAMVIVDMPFPTNVLGKQKAIEHAARILKETGCQGVKLESGSTQTEVVAALVAAGIPVMAHCGLRPQSVRQLGGYSVQRDRELLLANAKAAEQAGAFAMVLECIPAALARDITAQVQIPTIGIGAGPDCDGQVLVFHDLLGLTHGRVPKHTKVYADLKTTVIDAATRYRNEVREGSFPGPDQTFS